MISSAIRNYGLNTSTLKVLEILPENAHGDLHFKIEVDGVCYSARFVGSDRYDHDVFGYLTDDVLVEQMRFCDYLNDHGIPFMLRKTPADGSTFIHFTWDNVHYRFLLFEWIEGEHITHCTPDIAYKFGVLARRYHDVSGSFDSPLPRISHLVGYQKFIGMIQSDLDSVALSNEDKQLLQAYINQSEHLIKCSFSDAPDFIMQSDLNPLNIIWGGHDDVIGIIDFEHIGYTDRIECLAWLIKWYSRTHGIGSSEVSSFSAQSLLRGYRAEEFLTSKDIVRLQSLVWLSGCLNWGFVVGALDILNERNGRSQSELKEHLKAYQLRGEKLLALLT
ncbi:aminoglycoside phosphotransferase family protein [Jeotgalibacillus sp. R-1-5s-1]|nr:aminoglycoside phosphotransferase family protein [Jeotgalibacillus sp. R-1-5s-1]